MTNKEDVHVLRPGRARFRFASPTPLFCAKRVQQDASISSGLPFINCDLTSVSDYQVAQKLIHCRDEVPYVILLTNFNVRCNGNGLVRCANLSPRFREWNQAKKCCIKMCVGCYSNCSMGFDRSQLDRRSFLKTYKKGDSGQCSPTPFLTSTDTVI